MAAENFFGGEVAASYDADSAEMFEPSVLEPAIGFLWEMAAGGPVLELGIGTGRMALPLVARGLPVEGIELSEDMIAQLRAKPGGAGINVEVGDFSTTKAKGRNFTLAYLVFNTIMNLTSQDEQVACFCNVAEQLAPGGRFVVEVGVPDLQRLPHGERFRPFTVSSTRLGFDEYDVVAQGLISHHYWIGDGVARLNSVPFRYVWPSELDLMARIAGLSLEERWGSWRRDPFSAGSRSHVSVWRKPV